MRLELKITERSATLEVVALTNFEVETLARLKRELPEMIPSLEIEEYDGSYRDDAKGARISIDFLPPRPPIPVCPPDCDITDSLKNI